MNRSIFVRLALVLCLCSLSLAQTDPVVLSCESEILTKLKSSAGTAFAEAFHSTPQESTSEICKLQWGLNKTCCKPERINALAEKLVSSWKERVENFIKKLDVIEKEVASRAESTGLRVSELKAKVTANSSALTSTRIDPNLVTRATQISENAEKLTEQIRPENFSKGKSEYLKNIKECFETIKTFRSGALCGICSGNSSALLSEGRVKITKDTCVKITGVCAKSWQFMFETMQNIKAIQTVAKIEQAISSTGNTPKIVDESLSSIDVVQTQELMNDLRTVSTLRPEAVVYNDLVGRICTKLLTVDSEPNPNIDGDITRVESVIEIEKQVKAKEESSSDEEKKALASRIESAKKLRETAVAQKQELINEIQNELSIKVTQAEAYIQQAKIQITALTTELNTARQNLSTATTTDAKLLAEISVDEKIGSLNTKIATLDAKKTEISTKIQDAMRLCPLGGCAEIRTASDTFSRKVEESAPQIKKKVEAEREKVAEQVKKQLDDQDLQIRAQVAAVEAKKAEFEQAFKSLQTTPTDAAKLLLVAKTAELKIAGEQLAAKVDAKNVQVGVIISRNGNTFREQPKLLDQSMNTSVETIKKVQEAVKISPTVDINLVNTLIGTRNPSLSGSQTTTVDYKAQLTTFSSIGSTTDLRQIIKPPPPPPTDATTTGTTGTGSTTNTTPPKLRILQTANTEVTVVDNGTSNTLSYPSAQDGAPTVNTSLTITQQSDTIQGEVTRGYARAASILAVLVFNMIATIF